MGAISSPNRVKLFCGIIFSDAKIKQNAFDLLEKQYGKIDFISVIIPFDFSDYYNHEMGGSLMRLWISFENLILPDTISDIKVFTNSIENGFCLSSKRQINIDPGYITPANVVLVSTKDFSHRIYLSKGIYGEVTTIYKKNEFIKLPWSYPDYISNSATDFLLGSRKKLIEQLRGA